jgi:uncharacterized protein (DUF433 family)
MFETLQTKPMLGTGIYTIPDISLILGIPYSKINRWVNSFWNDKFAKNYSAQYTWNVDATKAVNFFTMIEIYTFYQLSLSGVTSREILNAHEKLSAQFNTPYPFAKKEIINCLRTDGKKVLFEQRNGVIYSLDIRQQTYLGFIKEFFKNLDFDDDSVALRLWPMGKEKSIVCDPHHQFGQPVISGTNINAETLYELYKSGEPEWFIADLYKLSVSKVNDAILFCKNAA